MIRCWILLLVALVPLAGLGQEVDGKGTFAEHVILDAGLGGHETMVGDVDGDIDICSKPWSPNPNNANGGKSHFSFLENLTISTDRETR